MLQQAREPQVAARSASPLTAESESWASCSLHAAPLFVHPGHNSTTAALGGRRHSSSRDEMLLVLGFASRTKKGHVIEARRPCCVCSCVSCRLRPPRTGKNAFELCSWRSSTCLFPSPSHHRQHGLSSVTESTLLTGRHDASETLTSIPTILSLGCDLED